MGSSLQGSAKQAGCQALFCWGRQLGPWAAGGECGLQLAKRAPGHTSGAPPRSMPWTPGQRAGGCFSIGCLLEPGCSGRGTGAGDGGWRGGPRERAGRGILRGPPRGSRPGSAAFGSGSSPRPPAALANPPGSALELESHPLGPRRPNGESPGWTPPPRAGKGCQAPALPPPGAPVRGAAAFCRRCAPCAQPACRRRCAAARPWHRRPTAAQRPVGASRAAMLSPSPAPQWPCSSSSAT